MTDHTTAAWRKSTRSNPNNNCVEVALMPDGGAAVRDSKECGNGPVLRFTAGEWAAFAEGMKAGEFDTPA